MHLQGLTKYREREREREREQKIQTELCFYASSMLSFFSYASILSYECTHESCNMDFAVRFMKQKI